METKTLSFSSITIDRVLLVLIFTIFTFLGRTQSEQINEVEKAQVTKQIKILEKAIQKSDFNLIKDYLSVDFTTDNQVPPISTEHVLPSMLQQFPKADITILNIQIQGEKYLAETSILNVLRLNLFYTKNFQLSKLEIVKNVDFSLTSSLIIRSEFTLPFHLVDGFIFIDGKVNNVEGRLMFDTGTPFFLFLNNHYIPLDTSKFTVNGSSGSGQTLHVYMQDKIDSVSLSNTLSFKDITEVPHTDLSFIEQGVMGNILGFLGYEFLKNYQFVINYDYQTIDFYALNNKEGQFASIDKNEMVTTLNFKVDPDMMQLPIVEFTVDGMAIEGTFDTGAQGKISLTKELKDQFIKKGHLIPVKNAHWYGQESVEQDIYILRNLKYKDIVLHDIYLKVSEGESNTLSLGYQFLKNYTSIWNFKDNSIILLDR